jgi:hypothetical protein
MPVPSLLLRRAADPVSLAAITTVAGVSRVDLVA